MFASLVKNDKFRTPLNMYALFKTFYFLQKTGRNINGGERCSSAVISKSLRFNKNAVGIELCLIKELACTSDGFGLHL